jgi:hypothetical protein
MSRRGDWPVALAILGGGSVSSLEVDSHQNFNRAGMETCPTWKDGRAGFYSRASAACLIVHEHAAHAFP